MRPPRLGTAAALAGSIALHAAVLLAPPAPEPPAAVSGGGPEAPARLGTAFADLAAGTLHPAASDPAARADPAPAPRSVPAAAQPAPKDAAHPSDIAPAAVRSAPAAPVATAPIQSHGVAAARSPTLERAPRPETVASASPGAGDSDAQRAPDTAFKAAQTHTATAAPLRESSLAPKVTPRPPQRPDRTVRPEPARPPAAAAPQGTVAVTARAGNASGQPDAAAPQAARRAALDDRAGEAARANYPGEVIRRLRATPQTRVRGRGEVTVSFTITATGGVAELSVPRGSGQPSLDAAALDHIRRAAPFPVPPPGAQTRFSLPVTFR